MTSSVHFSRPAPPSLTVAAATVLLLAGCNNGNVERDQESVNDGTPTSTPADTAVAPGTGGAGAVPAGNGTATPDATGDVPPAPGTATPGDPASDDAPPGDDVAPDDDGALDDDGTNGDDVSTSDAGTGPVAMPADGGTPPARDASIAPETPGTVDGGTTPTLLADGGVAPLSACDEACQAAGGVCDGNRCVFDCEGNDCDSVTCPNDYECQVVCGDGQCTGGVTCPDSDTLGCEVNCSGNGSCGHVTCGGGDLCQVKCNGDNSCQGGVSGGASSYELECNGQNSCQSGVTCNATNCNVTCNGSNSCSGDVQASATNATINCNQQGTCGTVTCNTDNCTVNCNDNCTAVNCNSQNCNVTGEP